MPFDPSPTKSRSAQLADLIGSYIDQPNLPSKYGAIGNPTYEGNPSYPRFARELSEAVGVPGGKYDARQFGETYNPPQYRGIRFLLPQGETSSAPPIEAGKVPGYEGLNQEFLGHMITRGYPVLGGTGQLPGFKEGFNPIGFGQRDTPLGYAEQPSPFWNALEAVVNSLRSGQTSQANPSLFHEPTVTAGAGVEQGLNVAGDVLSDPRNAWMGFGPMAGMARFRRVPDLGRDLGGFNMPTSQMRKALNMPRPNRRLDEVPGGTEDAMRSYYTNDVNLHNNIAAALQDETYEGYHDAVDLYKRLSPEERQRVDDVMKGLARLEGEKAVTKNSTSGGAAPPPWAMPKDASQIANELDMKRRQEAYRRWTEHGE